MPKLKYLIILLFSILGYIGTANITSAQTSIDILDIPEGQTQTFTRDQSPYIITTGIYVMDNAKLRIEQGTILKFKQQAILDVFGQLEVTGANENFNRVIFTSYNDKQISPEFSGQQDPQPADWSGIIFEPGSKGSIQGARITYGDMMMDPKPPPEPPTLPGDDYEPQHQGVITVFDADVNIGNTIITNNYGGITGYNNPRVTITNSEIYDNLEYGVWLNTLGGQTQIQAVNNWWGYNSGPQHQTLNPQGQGNRVNSYVIFDPWELRNPPVIIIPGILGSWPNSKQEWELDPIFHTYDNLINGFKSQGYQQNQNLFPFPYNWRNSNVETAKLLKDKITEAKQKGKSPRVDIVAHSMGGLAARQYIQSNDYQNDVDHLVTLGTPHQGSPDSYLMWEGGVSSSREIIGGFRTRIEEKFKKSYFIFEAKQQGYDTLFKYIREKVVSVQELLPVYDYLREAETGNMRSYPENYPRNEFLENLDSSENLTKLNGRQYLKFINFIGLEEQANTVNIIRVIDLPEKFKDPLNLLWPHGYPEGLEDKNSDHGLELGTGDGTVPFSSANSIPFANKQILRYSHSELATETFDQVYYWLNGIDPPMPRLPKLNLFQRLLFFRVHSPIDFQVIDPQGRILGKDFNTNQPISEIPDAFYSGFNTDLEFITIPDPINGNYQILTQGTDTGSYEIKVSSINDQQTQEQSYQGQTQTGQNLNFKVEYNQESANPLKPIINTQEKYTVQDLIKKIDEYYHQNLIKDKYVKNYLKQLLHGVEISIKRIEQVTKELDEINEKLTKPDLKLKQREHLKYQQWLYQQRIEFHKQVINKNLNKFIEKINQYQPNIIESEPANTLIKMAQNILANY